MRPSTKLFVALVVFTTTTVAQQSAEVFNDASSFRGAPKFRDASEFPSGPSAQEPIYTPLNDLPPHQQGYQIINPQYANLRQSAGSSQKLSESHKETIRRQEEFLKSVLGDSDSKGSQNVLRTSTILPPTFNRFDYRIDDNQFDQFDLKRTSVPSAIHNAALRLSNDRRVNSGAQSSLRKETSTLNRFGNSQNPSSSTERNDRFGDRRFAAGVVNEGKTADVNFRQQTHFSNERHKPQPVSIQAEVFPTIEEESVTVKGLSPVTPAPGEFNSFDANAGDDEESRFISQVNRNTAAFVSGNNGFREELGGKGAVETSFLAQQLVTPSRTENRTPTFGSEPQLVTRNKPRTKGVLNRVRNQNEPQFDDFGFSTSSPASTRFQEGNFNQNDREAQLNTEVEAKKQAENANYAFSSSVSDTINDNTQIRKEVRNGLKLSGLYSYSDGFFKRTVFYEADEKGYRIVKEESEPIGRGPQFNPNGEIEVNSQQSGSAFNYKVRGDQLRTPKKSVGQRELELPTGDQLPL